MTSAKERGAAEDKYSLQVGQLRQYRWTRPVRKWNFSTENVVNKINKAT